MSPTYFIFSLPRSGTSWLSVFLSGPDAYCYHEPTADASPHEWEVRARSRPERTVGAVDTCAYRYPHLIRRLSLGNIRCIELVRDTSDIHRSLEKVSLATPMDLGEEQDRLKAVGCTELIHYDLLDNLEYLRAVWDSLIGTPFDSERATQLIEMRVQRDPSLFVANRPNLNQHLRSLLT